MLEDELRDYPAFEEWLNKYMPDWNYEYSGNILNMLEAWKASLKVSGRETIAASSVNRTRE